MTLKHPQTLQVNFRNGTNCTNIQALRRQQSGEFFQSNTFLFLFSFFPCFYCSRMYGEGQWTQITHFEDKASFQNILRYFSTADNENTGFALGTQNEANVLTQCFFFFFFLMYLRICSGVLTILGDSPFIRYGVGFREFFLFTFLLFNLKNQFYFIYVQHNNI